MSPGKAILLTLLEAVEAATAKLKRSFDSNLIPQHQFLGVWMEIHLSVHSLWHRVAVQVMLEPVRSYVSGTISSTSPCRVSSMRSRSSNLPQAGVVLARQVIRQEVHQLPDTLCMGSLA
jgi:hypothetical protein